MVVDGELAEALTLPPTDAVARLKGGRRLRPEESVNLSVGAVFSLGAVNVSADWFRIGVDDRIALTQQNLSDADRAELVAANIIGAQTVTAVSFFVNDIRTETTGADFVVDSGFDWAGGRATLTLAGNVTRTTGARARRDAFGGRRAGTRGLTARFTRVALTFDYARGAWSGWVRMNYYDDVYEHLLNCERCAITTDALSVLDAEVSWDVSGAYSVALGVQNLFDRQPDKHRFAGVAGYLGADFPLNHPSGFDGGAYYLRFGAAF